MAGNIVQITFNEDLPVGSNLFISGVYSNGFGNIDLQPNWIWNTVRDAPYKVETGTPTAIAGERTAINFVTSFNLDMNGTNQHTVSRSGNVVTIDSLYTNTSGYTWDEGYAFKPNPGGGFPLNADVEFTFSLDNNSTPFNITNIEYLAYTPNRCGMVQVRVIANLNIKDILSPVSEDDIVNDEYTFNYIRGASGTITITSTQTSPITISQTFETPPLLSENNQIITVNNSPNGATIVLTSINQQGLTLQYALVPPNTSPASGAYQDENTYTGIAPGDYWIYFKDQYGCVKYKSITIDEYSDSKLPYFYISKSNSIRFSNRITWGDSENYKNDENTLSCEVDVELPYKEIQQFQSADVITTQFKSNYATNTASVIKEDGTIINIPIIQKTNNIGIKDKRDARKYSLGDGKTGVYFLSGNIYDYDTNIATDTYSLNGSLPQWAIAGNYLSIDSAFYLIEDIIFDESKNANVIVFINDYSGLETDIVVGSIYNSFNFEIFEFTIDMVNYINEYFRVQIESTDADFTTITHLSEQIWCKVKHDNVLEIRYRNTTNTDVMYSTGIEHKIRVPYLKISGKIDENSEVHKTDTDAILLSADLYEVDDFLFEPVTKEMWRKLMIALSHEEVFINGVGYVKNGEFNTEGPLDNSNLYVLTATMIKTGNIYNSQTSGNLDFNTTPVEIPGLIATESGYVKYE